jgi:autotransporter-associated beta strand protein
MAWNGARIIANPIQYPSATNNLTLIIGGINALTFTGPITLNGNDGNGTFTNRTFQVTNTALTTFSGVVGGTGFGLTKTGNGILALSNAETYTGPTTVSNGTLQVNGSLDASSAVTVNSNGILAGTGTVNGAVTVDAGGTLAPGTSIGTLTLNGGLILNGNLLFEVKKGQSQSNDFVMVSGTLTNIGAGFLAASNLGPALVVGDTFYLFNKPLTNGAALTVAGGGPGVAWNNHLATDGSISVASITNLNPGINIVITNGTNVVLSGTGARAGANYYILSQTNLTKPLTNWIRIYTNTFLTEGAFSVTLTNAFSTGIPHRFFIFNLTY